jgi:hypothetical protein
MWTRLDSDPLDGWLAFSPLGFALLMLLVVTGCVIIGYLAGSRDRHRR